MAEIVTAVISAGAALGVCLINNIAQNRKQQAEFDKALAKLQENVNGKFEVIEVKFDNMHEEVQKHNNLVERMYVVERDVSNLKIQQENACKRITDIQMMQ